MRITTWNVNGLRSVLSKGALDWVFKLHPDILCFQEIKTKPEQVSEDFLCQPPYSLYEKYWHSSERPGYSGVSTWAKIKTENVRYGIGDPLYDREGRVVTTEQNGFWLYNVYCPNGKRDHSRLTYKLDFYARLLDIVLDKLSHGENVVICGDINTAHNEIDLRNPKQNQNTSGFLPQERAWLDQLLANGFVDAYRQLHPVRVQYTWWTYRIGARGKNIGWRLDYFLVSEPLMAAVKDVVIHDEIYGSDHCPVSLLLCE